MGCEPSAATPDRRSDSKSLCQYLPRNHQALRVTHGMSAGLLSVSLDFQEGPGGLGGAQEGRIGQLLFGCIQPIKTESCMRQYLNMSKKSS